MPCLVHFPISLHSPHEFPPQPTIPPFPTSRYQMSSLTSAVSTGEALSGAKMSIMECKFCQKTFSKGEHLRVL